MCGKIRELKPFIQLTFEMELKHCDKNKSSIFCEFCISFKHTFWNFQVIGK